MTQFEVGKTYKMENGLLARLHFNLSEPSNSDFVLVGERQFQNGAWTVESWTNDGKTTHEYNNLKPPETRTYGNVYESDNGTSVTYWHATLSDAKHRTNTDSLQYQYRVCRIARGDHVRYEIVEGGEEDGQQ